MSGRPVTPISFNGGAAAYLTPSVDELFMFVCEEVVRMRVAKPEYSA